MPDLQPRLSKARSSRAHTAPMAVARISKLAGTSLCVSIVIGLSLLAGSTSAADRTAVASNASAKARPECANANAVIEPKKKAIAAAAPGIEQERQRITASEQALAVQRADLAQGALAAMIASTEYQDRSAAVAERKEELDVAGRRARTPEAVTKLNKRISDFNKELAVLNEMQAKINAASAASNAQIAAHNAAIAAHNSANVAFNARLAEHEQKVQELNALIARYRSRCGARHG